MGPHRSGKSKFPKIIPLPGGGKCFSFHFSSTYYLVFAPAVKKVHLPLQVVPIMKLGILILLHAQLGTLILLPTKLGMLFLLLTKLGTHLAAHEAWDADLDGHLFSSQPPSPCCSWPPLLVLASVGLPLLQRADLELLILQKTWLELLML